MVTDEVTRSMFVSAVRERRQLVVGDSRTQRDWVRLVVGVRQVVEVEWVERRVGRSQMLEAHVADRALLIAPGVLRRADSTDCTSMRSLPDTSHMQQQRRLVTCRSQVHPQRMAPRTVEERSLDRRRERAWRVEDMVDRQLD